MEEALLAAQQADEARWAAGFDQLALDKAARLGFSNGAFEDSEEDTGAIVEEFFPVIEEESSRQEPTASPAAPAHSKPSLAERLDAQVQRQSPSAEAH
ncbi:hypothetical protein D3C81_2132360 [compost metagenome]